MMNTKLLAVLTPQFSLSKVRSSGNILVAFYWKLPMVRKDTSIVAKYQKLLLGWHLLNYKDMSVEIPIYIRYAVITIVIFTSMLSIELFYLTQLYSFLGYFFEYLTLFISYRFAVYA